MFPECIYSSLTMVNTVVSLPGLTGAGKLRAGVRFRPLKMSSQEFPQTEKNIVFFFRSSSIFENQYFPNRSKLSFYLDDLSREIM